MKTNRLSRAARRNMARELSQTANTPWRNAWHACKGDQGAKDAQIARKAISDARPALLAKNRIARGEPIPIEIVKYEAAADA